MNEQENILRHDEYKLWLANLKAKVKQTQLKAIVTVNQQLLMFYWELGLDIIEKQKNATWGEGSIKQLSSDLMAEFPEIKGFSERNLRCIRQWASFWSNEPSIWQQAVAKFIQIPWGHNLVIIDKCQSTDEGFYYVKNTIEYGWSRSILTHQIESNLWQREGKAISNFARTLPSSQSDLAHQTFNSRRN